MITYKYNVGMSEFLEDIKAIVIDNWKENTGFQEELPLDLDSEGYEALYQGGFLQNILVTNGEEVVGYAVFFILPFLHSKGVYSSTVDVLYVKPEYRSSRIGLTLIKEIETISKDLGAKLVTHKVKKENFRLGCVLTKKGYKEEECAFIKLL